MIYFFVKKYARILTGVVLSTQFCGCSSPDTSSFTITFNSEKDMNPDVNGRSSPLDVHIYQLSNTQQFSKASFFDLYHDAKSTLGNDLLEEHRIEIKPQQEIKVDIVPLLQATHIGLVFAYHNIKESKWREILNLPSTNLKISLKSEGVKVVMPGAVSLIKEKD